MALLFSRKETQLSHVGCESMTPHKFLVFSFVRFSEANFVILFSHGEEPMHELLKIISFSDGQDQMIL